MAARPLVRALHVFAVIFAVLSQCVIGDFQSCIAASASTIILRTSAQSDFNYVATRGIFVSPTPSVIATVYSDQDVVKVVRCSSSNGLQVCARSGGHSFTGQSTCRDVLVDVRNLNSLYYDPRTMQLTVGLGNLLGEIFYTAVTASAGARMIGVGLCPSVGSGGYLLGGGFNPYAGPIGLTCESLASIDIVTGAGQLITASPTSNSELFWASCGGGGGHYGIATRAVLNTHDATDFNNNVFFRFTWPREVVGQLLSQWMDYDQENGRVWFRMELRAGEARVYGYGVCWASPSTQDCMNRLSRGSFFSIPGRTTSLLYKASRVAEFQAFIGPSGDWGNKVASVSDSTALLNKAYLEAGIGVHRVYSSGFFKFPASGKPSVATLQALANTCMDQDMSIVGYLICIFNPWTGGMKHSTKSHAFAHHDSDAFTEFIGDFGNPGNTAGKDALEKSAKQFRQLLRPYFSGIYVNYPEFGLSDKDAQYLHWGQGLQRLAYLRASVDPTNSMAQIQGLPMGQVPCPAYLKVSWVTPMIRVLQIVGYDIGQLINMRVSWTMSSGCSVEPSATTGAELSWDAGVWTARVYSEKPFQITVNGGFNYCNGPGSCVISSVAINGISCPGRVIS
jgi:hypothetical protein